MKIIITGIAGLVGLNLLTKIDGTKYDIIAIDKNKHNLKLAKEINPKIKVFDFDLSMRDKKWEELFSDTDCVVQLQAQISAPEEEPYVRNNVYSVKNVLEVCEKYKIKNLIHLSSSVVISVAKDYYTQTKTRGEELVKKSRVPYTILRPPLMYGCFDIKHMGFLLSLLDKSPIFPVPGNGKYLRQPLYVMDMVRIILGLIEKKPENKIYNTIGKEKIDFIDMVKKMASEEKRRALFIKIPMNIFTTLLKLHGFFISKKPFVNAQLEALIAGDIFPVEKWDETFKVPYTPFKEGVREMVNSKYYHYKYKMKK